MSRGFVLLAVMIGLAMALVAAAALLQLAQVETTGAFHSVERAQSHALTRSGLSVLSSELASQREDMLAGGTPRVDEQYVLYEHRNRLGVIRMLPVGPGDSLIESETSKLDINEVTAGQLVATGLVEEELAARIMQLRDKALGRPIQSLSELVHVPEMTNELLFGPPERLAQQLASVKGARDDEQDAGNRMSPLAARSRRNGVGETALADVLTVYSIESDLRTDGTPRIDLSTPPEEVQDSSEMREGSETEEDREQPAVELDADLPRLLRPLRRIGVTFAEPSNIASVLRQNNRPAEEWPEYFEVCTTQPNELRHGRIDINRASVQALLGVPGFTVEHAEAIAAAQETLSDDERATVCWPLLAGIIEPEPFSEALDHITNRSWCYRVRFAAGEVSGDEPDGALESPTITEVVFDLASPTPRVAYLRDMTLMPTMLAVAERNERTSEAAPFAERMQSNALDDELIAWDEAYGEEEEEPAEPEAAEESSDRSTARPTLPAQPSLPDVPSLPTPGEDAADATSDDGSQPSEGASEDSPEAESSASPIRRFGRWRAGSTQ